MPKLIHRTWQWSLIALLVTWPWPAEESPEVGFRIPGLRRSFETLVPAEIVHHVPIAQKELEALRQSLRILDSQYVERQRVVPRALLLSGLEALRQAHPHLVEIQNAKALLVNPRHGPGPQARLCITGPQMDSYELCPPPKGGLKGSQLSAKASLSSRDAPRSASEFVNANEPLLIRVGPRIFVEEQIDEQGGLLALDPVVKPIVMEVARQNRTEILSELHVFLNGMLARLDPHSAYMNPSEYRELHIGTRGQFGGVGIVVNTLGSIPVVDEVVPASPAHRAGVKSGDIIVRVGKSGTIFQNVNEVVDELRSQTQLQEAQVWFYRPSTRAVFRANLRREEILTKTVEARRVPKAPDLLFVRITNFSEQTAEELWSAYEKAQKGRKLKAMVLDLRGNPGGLLDEAVEVSDLFLQHGRIVSVKSRFDEQEENATRGSHKIGVPLVVLVNASSASASEIVAGALRDQNRALIVGERTFGKGSVQSLFETGFGTALKLTVAHHFTPSGTSIQGTGIQPHVGLRLIEERSGSYWAMGASEEMREAELPHHLDNPDTPSATEVGKTPFPQVWIPHVPTTPSELFRLEEVDRFPTHLTLSGETVNVTSDGLARTAIHAAQLLGQRHSGSAITPYLVDRLAIELQKLEIDSSRAELRNHFLSKGAGQGLIAGDLSPRKCCNNGTRTFRVLGDDALQSGLVGLKFSGGPDGPVAWIPVTSFSPQEQGGKKASFQLPPSVIAFVSGKRDEQSRIAVTFRRSFSDEEIPVGELVVESAQRVVSRPEIVVTPWVSCGNGNESCSRVRIVLHEPAATPLSLELIPLTSAEHVIDGLERTFQPAFNGQMETAFTIVRQGKPREQDFGGVVGALLRNEEGEIIARWPLVSIGPKGAERMSAASDPNRMTWR